MPKFWLATFESDPPMALRPSLAEPLAAAGARAWAVEVIRDDVPPKEIAVLFSTVDDANHPTTLECQVGFANGSKSCNVWRDRGFPLVDAIINVSQTGDVTVSVSCFLKNSAEMNYEALLITIRNIVVPLNDAGSSAVLDALYTQKLEVPDSAFPATEIVEKTVKWSPKRYDIRELKETRFQFKGELSRFPDLKPFNRSPKKIWFGTEDLPQWRCKSLHLMEERAPRLSRPSRFGPADFRFEDVEVLGFRIDLTKYSTGDNKHLDNELAELVKPLNFHLPADGDSQSTHSAVSDFQYRSASRTLMLELLRYGKMKLKNAPLPLTEKDFQSQHELVVRVLVGRVDDDTAQARDPATFVPTIFVDNPWSKVLARAVQGYDKRMADFCVLDDSNTLRPLRPDGRLLPDDKEPKPLASIAEIHLAKETKEAEIKEPSGHILLKLACPYQNIRNRDWDAFDKINPNLVFGAFPFPPIRWQQTDFDEAEYSRSFARSVLSKTPSEIQSIQVSPVGEKKLQQALKADTAWITGSFRFGDDLRVARPDGTVSLTFYAEKDAPAAWKLLCKLLGINEGNSNSISFPSGSWYRIRCSMDFKGDNGLG
jgi:hypothetical protein